MFKALVLVISSYITWLKKIEIKERKDRVNKQNTMWIRHNRCRRSHFFKYDITSSSNSGESSPSNELRHS